MGSDWDSVASHQDGFLTPVNSCFPVCPNTQQRAWGGTCAQDRTERFPRPSPLQLCAAVLATWCHGERT